MAEDSGWCTIESDPGVFTELLSSIGVNNVQVEELYSLDKAHLSSHGKVYGLVFLFKYDKKLASTHAQSGKVIDPPPANLFFANQTIHNACATQAILSIVMNAPDLKIGAELERFRDFCTGMDAMTMGMVIGNSDVIRSAHNSFAPQQQFVVEDAVGEKEDPFHFVAYIPYGGKVYELDGLQKGPIELGESGQGDEWLDVVKPILEKRMSAYGEGGGEEIRFNLMMVVEDARERLKKEVEEKTSKGESVEALLEEIERIEQQHAQWRKENVRRRWNYVPFAVEFLKLLAKEGKVGKMIKEVREKKRSLLREEQSKQSA